jgi:hypothetical protein
VLWWQPQQQRRGASRSHGLLGSRSLRGSIKCTPVIHPALSVCAGSKETDCRNYGPNPVCGDAKRDEIVLAARARRSPSARLYSAVPRSSQWPSTVMTMSGQVFRPPRRETCRATSSDRVTLKAGQREPAADGRAAARPGWSGLLVSGVSSTRGRWRWVWRLRIGGRRLKRWTTGGGGAVAVGGWPAPQAAAATITISAARVTRCSVRVGDVCTCSTSV